MFDENTRIRDTYYSSTSTKNEGDHDKNACIKLLTTQQTYTVYEYISFMSSVSRPKNERLIDWQSRGSWGALFYLILECCNRF